MNYSKVIKKIVRSVYKEFIGKEEDIWLFPVLLGGRLQLHLEDDPFSGCEAIEILQYAYRRFYKGA